MECCEGVAVVEVEVEVVVVQDYQGGQGETHPGEGGDGGLRGPTPLVPHRPDSKVKLVYVNVSTETFNISNISS